MPLSSTILTSRVSASVALALDELARAQGVTRSAAVRTVIEQALRDSGANVASRPFASRRHARLAFAKAIETRSATLADATLA